MENSSLELFLKIAENKMDKKYFLIFLIGLMVVGILMIGSLNVNASVFGDGVGINITTNNTNQTGNTNDLIMNRTYIGKVAYIVKNKNFVDENIGLYLDNKDLIVDVITDNKIPMTDFDDYDLIIVGKGKLINYRNIPLTENLILASNYHADYFGFVRGRVSRFAANSPLKVVYNDDILRVYDKSSFKLGRDAIPYYYLSEKNLLDNVNSVAKAYKGGNHYLGDVVSYIEVTNSNNTVRRCFYGIIASANWERDAEILLDNCIDFTSGMYNHNVGIVSNENSVNGISIKEVTSDDFIKTEIAELNCESSYIVNVDVKNTGDFSDNVELHGMIGEEHFIRSKTINPDKTKSFSENMNFELASGDYNLIFNAEIKNGVDSDTSDNSRQRQIRIVC